MHADGTQGRENEEEMRGSQEVVRTVADGEHENGNHASGNCSDGILEGGHEGEPHEGEPHEGEPQEGEPHEGEPANGNLGGGVELREDKLCGKTSAGAIPPEEREGLEFGWKDLLALSIAFVQVTFTRVVIAIASFALVIYLLGKFWLKCW